MFWLLKKILVLFGVLIAALAVTGVLTYKKLPDNSTRKASFRLPADPDAPLAKYLWTEAMRRSGESGIFPLPNSRDAFAARLVLAELAKHSLDLQYYIYHDDISGRLMSQSLLKAAGRGVRVRLLLDDHTMAGMDPLIAVLNAHENIEVRLFNPYMQRGFRPLGYLSDFFRLNRRMHNKSFTADSVVAIVGGRNIGDEYFAADSGVMFADLDVAAIGDAAQEVAQDFDRYWNSEAAYPAENIIAADTPLPDIPLAPAADEVTQAYLRALAESGFARRLREGRGAPPVRAKARLVSDTPAKVLGKAKARDNLFNAHIAPLISAAQEELIIVSPYFVPTGHGTALLNGLAAQGREVVVVTNTLAANDVAMVHSGYAKYRKALLEGGVKLYELKADATVKPGKIKGVPDTLGTSLHAKTFSVDNRYIYVGSFNMDPRSARLNTEMGLIIDHPGLAAPLGARVRGNALQYTYAVSLDAAGRLQWQTLRNGETVTEYDEPQSSFFKRAQVWVAARLPIEWLL